MGSFSIREAVMIIALMAVAFAAAAQNSYGLVSLFSMLLLLHLSFNSLQAVVGVGKRRIKAIGVCVFGWSFIGATTLQFVRPEKVFDSGPGSVGISASRKRGTKPWVVVRSIQPGVGNATVRRADQDRVAVRNSRN